MTVLELLKESAGIFQLAVTDANGAVDLTDAEIRFYLKHKSNVDDSDESSYLIKKATANAGGSDSQIKVTDAAAGIAEIYFASTDTQNIDTLSYAYRYRVHVKPSGANNYIVISDKFRLRG